MSDEHDNIVDLSAFRVQKEKEKEEAEAAATEEEIDSLRELLDIFLSQFPPGMEPYYVPLTTSYLYEDNDPRAPSDFAYEYGYDEWRTIIDNEAEDEDL